MKGFVYRLLRSRIFSLVLGILYAVVYEYVYANYISVVFANENSSQHNMGNNFLLYIIIASLPLLFYRGIKHVASALSLFLYIFAYIPLINNLLSWGYPSSLIISYTIALLISMVLFFMTDHWYLLKKIMDRRRRLIPFKYLELLTVFLFAIVVITQRGNIHFVNFLDDGGLMYELRENNSMGGNYIVAWLRAAFFPLLLVSYLNERSYTKYAFTFFCYLVLYMIDMQKITFIYPFVLTGLFFLTRAYGQQFSVHFHTVLIALIVISALLIMSNLDSPIVYGIAAIFLMRTVCIEGMEMTTYLNFFELGHHPYTYYNHINIINAITHANPYPQSIGLAVTDGAGNANGVFWLMDGVAAAGVTGIYIIGLLFIIVKAIMNSMDVKASVPLCVCILLYGIQSMVNVSLFTALNSCGFIILFLIFMYFDLKPLRNNINI